MRVRATPDCATLYAIIEPTGSFQRNGYDKIRMILWNYEQPNELIWYFVFMRKICTRKWIIFSFYLIHKSLLKCQGTFFLSFFWHGNPQWVMACSWPPHSRGFKIAHNDAPQSVEWWWVISPKQRPLPDNTKHLQETGVHVFGGIRTHNFISWAAAILRLRARPLGPASGGVILAWFMSQKHCPIYLTCGISRGFLFC
jgi:hypothetical protein